MYILFFSIISMYYKFVQNEKNEHFQPHFETGLYIPLTIFLMTSCPHHLLFVHLCALRHGVAELMVMKIKPTTPIYRMKPVQLFCHEKFGYFC